jgi:hypothetical protein
MRFFFLPLLFSLSLAGQPDGGYTTEYVWAKSGLSVRAAGTSAAEKTGLLPFGTVVRRTGNAGQQVEITALKPVSARMDGKTIVSDPYVMNGVFVEIMYDDGKTGFVYDGYLSRLNPESDPEGYDDFQNWMSTQGGASKEIDLRSDKGDYVRRHAMIQYANGMTQTSQAFEGGASAVYLIPNASLNDGYLLAERYWAIVNQVDAEGKVIEDPDVMPVLLKVEQDGALRFIGEMSETVIRQIGDLLVIHASGGC